MTAVHRASIVDRLRPGVTADGEHVGWAFILTVMFAPLWIPAVVYLYRGEGAILRGVSWAVIGGMMLLFIAIFGL